jgi:hypothetical protein
VNTVEHPIITAPVEFLYHSHGTGETLPLRLPIIRPSGNRIDEYRITAGFYCTGDSTAWTLSGEQFRQFLQIQAVGSISPILLELFNPRGVVGEEKEMSPREKLFRKILEMRDSIEARRGILPESYHLIRKDRDR